MPWSHSYYYYYIQPRNQVWRKGTGTYDYYCSTVSPQSVCSPFNLSALALLENKRAQLASGSDLRKQREAKGWQYWRRKHFVELRITCEVGLEPQSSRKWPQSVRQFFKPSLTLLDTRYLSLFLFGPHQNILLQFFTHSSPLTRTLLYAWALRAR